MPRPGSGRGRPQEKSKDFFGSMKRLLKNMKSYKILVSLALILAMISAVLALIAPDKLSSITDEIGKGLSPRIENLEIVSKEIMKQFTSANISDKYNEIITSPEISEEDKKDFVMIFQSFSVMSDDEKMEAFYKIPSSILNILLDDIEIDGTKITVSDQVVMLDEVKQMTKKTDSMKSLHMIDKLPESIYDLVKPVMNLDNIRRIAIFIGIIYLLSALFSYIQNLSMIIVSNRFACRLRDCISNKINTLPLKYFDTHETGDVLSRITNDIDTISQNLNNSLSSLVSNITLFLGSIIMMFYTNWIMALTAIFSSIFGFLFMGGILGKSQKYFAASQKALGDLNGYIEEMYSGHSVIKVYNGVNHSVQEFDKLNQNLYEAKRKSIFLSGTMQPFMMFIGNLGYVAVCIVGALLAANNHISFGVIVAFIVYVRLFTNPLSQIAQAMTNLQSTAAASERVFEFLDEEEMSDEKNLTEYLEKEKIQGKVVFDHVKFGYVKKNPIIKDFSVTVNPGDKIAIVGPTGAGKTTLVNLLMKFYEINDGDILIDGKSIRNLTRENIHDLFVMVLQDTWVYEGTIRDNLKFNNQNVTDEEIWNICKIVGVDHFIKTLPGNLDYVLSESDSISSGQKQLLTIARGMIANGPFLILDEATSNVDTRTEELVQKAMDKLMEEKTSFIIAHRLSTIKNADLILVMKDGNIVEKGTHQELIEQNGFYSELYNAQFYKEA